MLRKLLIALTTASVVFVTACGGGGGDSSDPALEFTEANPSYVQGSVAEISAKNTTFNAPTAEVDGATVAVRLLDGQLIFVVPPLLSPGSHTLKVSDSGKTYSLPFTVQSAMTIADPAGYVEDYLDEAYAALVSAAASATGKEANFLQDLRNRLDAQRSAIGTLSADEALALARILAANPALFSEAKNAGLADKSYDVSSCRRAKTKAVIAGAASIVLAELTFASVVAAGGTAGFSLSVAILSTAGFTVSVLKTIENYLDSLKFCSQELLETVSSQESAKQATAKANNDLGTFIHAQSRTFVPKYRKVLADEVGAEDIGAAQRLAALLSQVRLALGELGIEIPLSYENSLLGVKRDLGQTSEGDIGVYSLGAISDSRITGTMSAGDSNIALRFSFKAGVAPNNRVPFTFTLVKNNGNEGTYSVQFAASLEKSTDSYSTVYTVREHNRGGPVKGPSYTVYCEDELVNGEYPPDDTPAGTTVSTVDTWIFDLEKNQASYHPGSGEVESGVSDSPYTLIISNGSMSFSESTGFQPIEGQQFFTEQETYAVSATQNADTRVITGVVTTTNTTKLDRPANSLTGEPRVNTSATCSYVWDFVATPVK